MKCNETGDKPVEIVEDQLVYTDNDKENIIDTTEEGLYENLRNVKQDKIKKAETELIDTGTELGEDEIDSELFEGMTNEHIAYNSTIKVFCAVAHIYSVVLGHMGLRNGWISYSLYEPPQDKTNEMACAPCEDSDQPGHLPSLIRVFTVHSMGS